MQPPAGPPVWTALKARPSTIPPPMSNTISRSVVPIGTSTRPVLTTRPASAKTFVPLLRRGPDRGEPVAAVADDRCDVGERLDVVDERRAVPQTGDGRIRRARDGRAPPALDRRDQRGLLAADVRAGAEPDVDLE